MSRIQARGPFDPAQIRPSAIGHCMRQEGYRCLGYEGSDGMKELEAIAFLGHVIEERLADIYSELIPGKVYRQFPLKTPYGIEAHPDIWVPSLNLDVEVKSVSLGAKFYGLPKPEHLDQHMLRLHFHHKYRHRPAKGELVYFFRETFWDPETRKPLVFQVEYDSQKGQELEDRLLYMVETIRVKGELPPREHDNPNTYPCQSRTRYFTTRCPYLELCWEGELEGPPPLTVAEAEDALKEYAALKEERKALIDRADAIKDRMEELQEELEALFDDGVKKIAAGEYVLSRSYVEPAHVEYDRAGYWTYRLSRAKKG